MEQDTSFGFGIELPLDPWVTLDGATASALLLEDRSIHTAVFSVTDAGLIFRRLVSGFTR